MRIKEPEDNSNKGKSKRTTKTEKEILNQFILETIIGRYTLQEAQKYILRVTGKSLSIKQISALRLEYKKSSAKWIVDLQKTRYEYTSIYLTRFHELEDYQRKLREMYDLAGELITNPISLISVRKELVKEMHSITKTITEIASVLPRITGFIPRAPKDIDDLKDRLNDPNIKNKQGLTESDKYSDIRNVLQDRTQKAY